MVWQLVNAGRMLCDRDHQSMFIGNLPINRHIVHWRMVIPLFLAGYGPHFMAIFPGNVMKKYEILGYPSFANLHISCWIVILGLYMFILRSYRFWISFQFSPCPWQWPGWWTPSNNISNLGWNHQPLKMELIVQIYMIVYIVNGYSHW